MDQKQAKRDKPYLSSISQPLYRSFIVHIMLVVYLFTGTGRPLKSNPSHKPSPILVHYRLPSRPQNIPKQKSKEQRALSSAKTAPKKTVPKKDSLLSKEALNQVLNQTLEELNTHIDLNPLVSTDLSTDDTQIAQTQSQWVMAVLQAWLTLPEYGEVTIKLTLSPQGHVELIELIESKSKSNTKYVFEALQHAKLPIQLDSEKTFTLVLSNDS